METTAVAMLTIAMFTCFISGTAAQCEGQVLTLRADTLLRNFHSPNHPRHYPNGAYCQWLIVAPDDDYRIRLDAVSMDLEPTQGCIYDSIIIYDGKDKATSLARSYCAGFFSRYSSGRYLLVVFRSDDNVVGTGFSLRYFAVLKNPPTVTTTLTTSAPGAGGSKGDNWLNTGALVGGVVGGVCLVIILGIICGRCLGTGGPRQPPVHRPAAYYHTHGPSGTPMHTPPDASALSAAVHMVQNNNSVFMVSQALGGNMSPPRLASQLSSGGGMTNMAYDGSGDYGAGMIGPPIGVPPPSYSESMLVTNPPSQPPTPRSVAPPVEGPGLAPPPLYAPRDPSGNPVLEEPGPSSSCVTSSASHLCPPVGAPSAPQLPNSRTSSRESMAPSMSAQTFLSAHTSQQSATFPGTEVSPQGLEQPLLQVSHVRAPAQPAHAAPATPSTVCGEEPDRGREGFAGFEFSEILDSASSGTGSTVLTSPSSTFSDPGSPIHEERYDDDTTQPTDNSRLDQNQQDVTSSQWPGEASRQSGVPASTSATENVQQDHFEADFASIEEARPAEEECLSDANIEQTPDPNTSHLIASAPDSPKEGKEIANISAGSPTSIQKQVKDDEEAHSQQNSALEVDHVPPAKTDTPTQEAPAEASSAPRDVQSLLSEQDANSPDTSAHSVGLSIEDMPAPDAHSKITPETPAQQGHLQKLSPEYASTVAFCTGETKVEVSFDAEASSATLSDCDASHQCAERTVSANSLPPPPSPHPSAGFDCDMEKFPPPPSPVNVDSDEDTETPTRSHLPVPFVTEASVLFSAESFTSPDGVESKRHAFSESCCSRNSNSSAPHSDSPPGQPDAPYQRDDAGSLSAQSIDRPASQRSDEDEDAGYLASGEDVYGAPSLSSQSSPMLMERQLRSSASFQELAGPVNALKRETFQRADSH